MRNMHCDGWTGDYSAICSFTALAKGENKGENHISWGKNDTSILLKVCSLFFLSLLKVRKFQKQIFFFSFPPKNNDFFP